MPKRIEYLDVAKGIGIMLIVLGHSKLPGIILSWIYSFHVPLFFIISGYLYKPRSISEIVRKGFKQLLIPMFLTNFLCILGLVALFLRSGIWHGPNLWNWIFDAFFMINNEAYVGMWFLCTLFWAKVWLALLIKYNIKYIALSNLILFLLAWQVHNKTIELPWYFLNGMACTSFLSIGYLLKMKEVLEIQSSIAYSFLSFFIVISAYMMPIDVHAFIYPRGFFSVLSSFVISLSLLFILKDFCNYLPFLRKKFVWIGENSLLILSIHALIHTWNIHGHIDFIPAYYVGLLEFLFILLCVYILNKNVYIYKIYHA